jgi:hypothetical protein
LNSFATFLSVSPGIIQVACNSSGLSTSTGAGKEAPSKIAATFGQIIQGVTLSQTIF